MEQLDNGVFGRDLASSSIYSPLLPHVSYKSPSLKEVFPWIGSDAWSRANGGQTHCGQLQVFWSQVHQWCWLFPDLSSILLHLVNLVFFHFYFLETEVINLGIWGLKSFNLSVCVVPWESRWGRLISWSKSCRQLWAWRAGNSTTAPGGSRLLTANPSLMPGADFSKNEWFAAVFRPLIC